MCNSRWYNYINNNLYETASTIYIFLIIHQILNTLWDNCGVLNSLILPLCNQTKYNNSDIGADDITIAKYATSSTSLS